MAKRILPILVVLFILPAPAQAKLDKETAQQVFSVLERATRSSDRQVRAKSVGHLSLVKGESTAKLVIDALKDPVWAVRKAAIQSLIRMRNSVYKEELYSAMLNRRRDMAKDIMPLLAMVSDKDAVSLSHKLLNDEKAMTKNDLITGWGQVEGRRREAFYKKLISHKDKSLAEGVQGFVLKLKGKGVLPLIQRVVKVGSQGMRLKALERLAKLPQGTKIPWLRKLLKARDPDIAIRAAEVLAHHGDRSVVKVLLPALASKNNAKIIRALSALVHVPGRDIVPHLRPFLDKYNRDVHHEIIEKTLDILFQVKDSKLLSILRELRTRDSIKIQAHAVYYLGLLEKGRGLPSLHEDMFHGDPNVRLAAIKAVGSIANAESIPHLKRALDNNHSGDIKEQIVKALANIHDKEIIPIVNFLITDPHPGVRKWAIVALTNVDHRDAVSSLKIATHDANVEARAQAVKAIMQLDKTEGFAVFRRAMGWIPPNTIRELSENTKIEVLPFLDMAGWVRLT
ncbi:MAG TPA: HEAT repeat domain-containing protein, partial [Myxococcales bacterium]|nr:HEAT repeat domain-containing protein [Myxococcales bacterium]